MIPIGSTTVYFPRSWNMFERVLWVSMHRLPGGIYHRLEFSFNPYLLS